MRSYGYIRAAVLVLLGCGIAAGLSGCFYGGGGGHHGGWRECGPRFHGGGGHHHHHR
jgi:hypothetical protein